VNPLFAAELPTDPAGELCHLAAGARSSDLVFFAVIGGVPGSSCSRTRASRKPAPREATRTGDPPLCDGKGSTTQTRGKAYRPIRELAIVRAMVDQGIVAATAS
jgi:hypothetical protein